MDIQEENSTRSSNYRYSKEFKSQVCEDYLQGYDSKTFIENKYKIGHGRVLYWLQELGYLAETPIQVFMSRNKKSSEEVSTTNKRIKELEKELENARLQSEAYRIMIEVAEGELKIKIRKK